MRLHSDIITVHDITAAARMHGLIIHGFDSGKSRTRLHGYTVYLEGSSPRQSNGRNHKAATWDEWGMFMSYLYTVDENAVWGSKAWGYKDAKDFHTKTVCRFEKGAPSDLHTQHKWVYDYERSQPFGGVAYHYCTGCSARTRRG